VFVAVPPGLIADSADRSSRDLRLANTGWPLRYSVYGGLTLCRPVADGTRSGTPNRISIARFLEGLAAEALARAGRGAANGPPRIAQISFGLNALLTYKLSLVPGFANGCRE